GVAGAARCDEDPDDCDRARGVRDREAPLRARGLSGARRLCEEHDHGGGADGWGGAGGECGGRADAADARAHSVGAPGGGALHRGVSEQGGQGGRQGAVGPGGAGGAGAVGEVRVSGGQDSGDCGGGDEGAGGGHISAGGAGDHEAAGRGGQLHSDAGAGGGQAVFDADRGRLYNQRAGHGGDGALRAGDREGGRRGGDRGRASPAEHGGGGGGEGVGVLWRGTKKEEVEGGMVLAKPKTITPHTKFKAEVYVLTKEEGGRHTPFFNGYRPQFYFRTTDVTGVVALPAGVEMVMPGDNVTITADLISPIAMDQGLRFAIREGGKTVGSGIVTAILA